MGLLAAALGPIVLTNGIDVQSMTAASEPDLPPLNPVPQVASAHLEVLGRKFGHRTGVKPLEVEISC